MQGVPRRTHVEVRGDLYESVLSFYYVGPRDPTQAARLVSNICSLWDISLAWNMLSRRLYSLWKSGILPRSKGKIQSTRERAFKRHQIWTIFRRSASARNCTYCIPLVSCYGPPSVYTISMEHWQSFSFVSWEYTPRIWLFVYTGRKTTLGKYPLCSEKLRKRKTFEKWSVLPFLFPLKQVTQTCEHTGSAAQAQQQSLKQLFLQTWVNIWAGSNLQWRVKSLLPAAVQHGRHTPTRPWGPLPALKAPNDTWAGER